MEKTFTQDEVQNLLEKQAQATGEHLILLVDAILDACKIQGELGNVNISGVTGAMRDSIDAATFVAENF